MFLKKHLTQISYSFLFVFLTLLKFFKNKICKCFFFFPFCRKTLLCFLTVSFEASKQIRNRYLSFFFLFLSVVLAGRPRPCKAKAGPLCHLLSPIFVHYLCFLSKKWFLAQDCFLWRFTSALFEFLFYIWFEVGVIFDFATRVHPVVWASLLLNGCCENFFWTENPTSMRVEERCHQKPGQLLKSC